MLVHFFLTTLLSAIHPDNHTNSSEDTGRRLEGALGGSQVIAISTSNVNGTNSSVVIEEWLEAKLNASLEGRLEGSSEDRNLSSSITKYNGTSQPNTTGDELAELELEMGLLPGTYINFTIEDDENFQDGRVPLFTHSPCHWQLLEDHSYSLCGKHFEHRMEEIGAENWCSFQDILRPYSDLMMCMEKLSQLSGCYYPNPSVEDFFLRTHNAFFAGCPEEHLLLTDAPHSMVVVLTLLPVAFIPVLIYLVVYKSNGQE